MIGPADRELLNRMSVCEDAGQWFHDSESTLRLEEQGLVERYEMGPSRSPSWRVTAAGRKAIEVK